MMRGFLVFTLILGSLNISVTGNPAEAENFYESGKINYLSCKYRNAVIDFENALTCFQADSNDHIIDLLNTRCFLVNAYWNSGEGRKAEKLARACYEGLTRFHDNENPGLVDSYLLLAEFYVKMDFSFEINDFLLDKAGRIITRYYQEDQGKRGILYSIKGYSDYLKHEVDNAYYYLLRSGEILSSYPDLIRYKYQNDVFHTLLMIDNKNSGEAIKYAENVMQREDVIPEARLLLMHAIAFGYIGLNDTVNVLKYCDRMIKAASLPGIEAVATKYFLLNRANEYLAYYQKNQDLKLLYLRKSLTHAQTMSDHGKEVAYLNYHIGSIYYSKKQYLRSMGYLQKALIASSFDFNDTSIWVNPPPEKLMNNDDLVFILYLKGTVLPFINSNDKLYVKLAVQCFEIADNLLDMQLHRIDMENSLLNNVDLKQKLHRPLVAYSNYIYRYTGEEEYARKAFHYSEKGKVQTLKIFTEKAEILKNCGVPDSIIKRYNRLGNEILKTENAIALMQDKDKVPGLTEKLTRLMDQRDFINYEMIKEYSVFQKSVFDLPIPGIENIQSVLQPNEALIEYELTDYEIIIYVITPSSFYQYYSPVTPEVDFHLNNLRLLASSVPIEHNDSTFKSFVKSSSFLYNLFIRPVYGRIQGKRLIIIPQDKLFPIPFEILISEEYNGRCDYTKLKWLIKEFPVMYAFSASYLVNRQDEKFGKGMAAFIPGYPESDENLSFLQGARAEGKFLRRKLGFKVFSGRRSGEENFIKNAPKFRIIHIAAHTLTNNERPDLSGFIMNKPQNNTNDGRLFGYEIKQLKLNAQMVILNGCNTGFGALKRGEGTVSLARSFFYTGIRTIAYTLWPVADRAARDLVVGFYNQIFKHQPPDIALMKAKVSFIERADPVKAHPYYWAGFIVSGRSQVIPCKQDYLKPVAAILLFLAIIAAYRTISEYQRSDERIKSA